MELQTCEDCGAFRFPPRVVCPKCLSSRANWMPVRGTGTVYVELEVFPRETAAQSEPYSLAIVELDEGVKLWSNVVGCAPGDVRIGDRVRLRYQDKANGSLPQFEPDV